MENGNLGVYPFFVGFFADSIKERPTDEDKKIITSAPKKKSPADKRKLGKKNFDINKGYE